MEQVGRDANAVDRMAVRLLLYAECSDAREFVPRAHSSVWLCSAGNVSLIFIRINCCSSTVAGDLPCFWYGCVVGSSQYSPEP